jgi:hypothetical protein
MGLRNGPDGIKEADNGAMGSITAAQCCIAQWAYCCTSDGCGICEIWSVQAGGGLFPGKNRITSPLNPHHRQSHLSVQVMSSL